jgi:hypothetical protein
MYFRVIAGDFSGNIATLQLNEVILRKVNWSLSAVVYRFAYRDVKSISIHGAADSTTGTAQGAAAGFLLGGGVGAALGAGLGANAPVTFVLEMKDGHRMFCSGGRSSFRVLEVAIAKAQFSGPEQG